MKITDEVKKTIKELEPKVKGKKKVVKAPPAPKPVSDSKRSGGNNELPRGKSFTPPKNKKDASSRENREESPKVKSPEKQSPPPFRKDYEKQFMPPPISSPLKDMEPSNIPPRTPPQSGVTGPNVRHPGRQGGLPPLFIKVDRYNEILSHLHEIKSYTLNLRDALDVLEDMQKEIETGIHVAHRTLDEINMIVSKVDSIFMKPGSSEHTLRKEEKTHSMRPFHPETLNSNEIENYAKDAYTKLQEIKSNLRGMEKPRPSVSDV